VEYLVNHRLELFALGSFFFLFVSRKALKNINSHGFYRFFAFEGILGLVCLNLPFWFVEPFSPVHLVSWLLLIGSIVFVINGLHFLKSRGGSGRREALDENFSFENTTELVTSGMYKYVRHPMYSSLLFLAWGAFFKNVSLVGVIVVISTTGFLLITAKIEEQENCDYFGQSYRDYMKSSKAFVPWVL